MKRLSTLLAVAALVTGCTIGGTGGSSASSGAVIHVDLRVPIRSADSAPAIGSACDVESLRATGPKAAMVPGADFMMADWDQLRLQSEAPGAMPTVAVVPATGTVVERSGDPDFPTDCSFTFDVPRDPDTQTWVFGVDSVYFPVPLIPRDQLEANNWTAIIGVNPQ